MAVLRTVELQLGRIGLDLRLQHVDAADLLGRQQPLGRLHAAVADLDELRVQFDRPLRDQGVEPHGPHVVEHALPLGLEGLFGLLDLARGGGHAGLQLAAGDDLLSDPRPLHAAAAFVAHLVAGVGQGRIRLQPDLIALRPRRPHAHGRLHDRRIVGQGDGFKFIERECATGILPVLGGTGILPVLIWPHWRDASATRPHWRDASATRSGSAGKSCGGGTCRRAIVGGTGVSSLGTQSAAGRTAVRSAASGPRGVCIRSAARAATDP